MTWKKLVDFGNRYAAQSDWTDYALVKCCVMAMGLFWGTHTSERHKPTVRYISVAMFAATYALLIERVIKLISETAKEEAAFVEPDAEPYGDPD